jgi:hypothetical protein
MTPDEYVGMLQLEVSDTDPDAMAELIRGAENLTDTGYRQGRADLALIVRGLADGAWEELSDENRDRQLLLENLITNLRRVTA